MDYSYQPDGSYPNLFETDRIRYANSETMEKLLGILDADGNKHLSMDEVNPHLRESLFNSKEIYRGSEWAMDKHTRNNSSIKLKNSIHIKEL